MSAALRAELFKQRSTRTAPGLLAAMLGLVVFVVLLHGLAIGANDVASVREQLTTVFVWGEVFGALFAALLGAMSITGEIRHGTIRPTFLVTPDRRRVVLSKAAASMLVGTAFGFVAGAVASGAGTAALQARGIDVRLGVGDYAFLIVGGAGAAALWAAIGLGVGAVVRTQVPALVGIVVWLLFVENLFVGDIAGVGDLGRFLPGFAGRAMSLRDADSLVAPGVGLVLLTIYAVVASILGSASTTRADFA